MEILHANHTHIPQIVDIWKDFMDCHKNIDPFFTRSVNGHEKFKTYLESVINNDEYLLLVITELQNVIGYTLAQIQYHPPVFEDTRYCLITDIVVKDEYRRQGLGQQLIEGVKTWAKGKNVTRIELKVLPGNTLAYKFYLHLGFKDYLHDLYLNI